MKKILIGTVATVISSLSLLFASQPDSLLHVYFLNVGQGDAIFITTPAGQNILVDGGPEKKILTELEKVLPFWNDKIDYVFLTHADKDHIEGLVAVLKKYRVGQVVSSGIFKKDYLSEEFLRLISEKNIPLNVADSNKDIKLPDNVTIDLLFPFNQTIYSKSDTGNVSLVSKVIYYNNEILLTGDAEQDIEEKLLEAGAKVFADVLKLGHHGSNTSTTEAFLTAVNPKYCVISVGKNNTHNHPHPSILKRLEEFKIPCWRTDLDGRVEMVFSETGLVRVNTQEISSQSRYVRPEQP